MLIKEMKSLLYFYYFFNDTLHQPVWGHVTFLSSLTVQSHTKQLTILINGTQDINVYSVKYFFYDKDRLYCASVYHSVMKLSRVRKDKSL
jgi:hypothetical protein